MNTRRNHDDKLIELVAVWKKLSAWNKFVVWWYAFTSLTRQKINSMVIELVRRLFRRSSN